MKNKTKPHNFFYTLLLSLCIGFCMKGDTLQSEQKAPHVTVDIQVFNATYDCLKGIHFDWHIKNVSPHIVYVYTPFLTGRSADRLEYDSRSGNILIPTSMKGAVSSPPYSYPEAEFRALGSADEMNGNFSEPISDELSCDRVHPHTLTLEVAWGSSTAQVNAEIAQIKKKGQEHPANPIVRWANLARSKPTQIRYVR